MTLPAQVGEENYIIDVFYIKLSIPEEPGFLLYGAAWKDEVAYSMNYGDQFPIKTTESVSIPTENDSGGNDQIEISHCTIRVDRILYERLETALNGGSMDLSLLNSPILEPLKAIVLARPQVVQLDRDSEWSRRVHSPAPESKCRSRFATVTTYWPISKDRRSKEHDRCLLLFAWLNSSAEGGRVIASITAILQGHTGLSFTGAYAQRIGCFELYRFKHTLADEQFQVAFESSSIGGVRALTGLSVDRPRRLQHEHHFVQVTLRNIHDITLSQVAQMPPGVSKTRVIQSPETFSEWSVTVYSSDGRDVVFHEHMHRMRGVGFQMTLITGQAKIADKFSSEQLASRKSLREKLETVAFGLRSRSEVSDFRTDPWYPRANALGAIVSQSRREYDRDRFFPRGDEGQVNVILYVKELLEEADNQHVIVADPFFDSHALSRILSRVTDLSGTLTVLTSLTSKHTDETSASLRAVVRKYQKMLPRNLQIITLSRGGDQAFHDRYIYLQKVNGRGVVYVLTNSLNKGAGNWPLCITPLGHTASLEVGYYLENLAKGVDVHAVGAEIKLDLIWPHKDPDTAESKQAEQPVLSVTRMEPALRWMLPQMDSLDESVFAAKECGLMNPDRRQASQYVVDGPLFLRMFESSWSERPISDVSTLASVLLGLGEMVANIEGRDITEGIISILRSSNDFSAKTSELLNVAVSLTAPGDQGSSSTSLTEASVLGAMRRAEVDVDALLTMSDIIGNRRIRVRSWGLRWITQIVTTLDPRGISDWLEATRVSVSSAQDLLSGWEALCEYPLDIAVLEEIIVKSRGPVQVYVLCHALGGYRIRPLFSLDKCASLLSGMEVDGFFNACVLLYSYKIRPRHVDCVVGFVDDLSVESLARLWGSAFFNDEECEDLLKFDRLHGPPCLSALAAALANGGFAAVSRGLDKAIVVHSQRDWKGHTSEHFNSRDVDQIETTLQAWLRIRIPSKPFGILPNPRELAKSVAEVCRPFAEESGGPAWRIRVRSLVCYSYVGVRLYSLLKDAPRADDFERSLLPHVVVPVLSLYRRLENSINDQRVILELESFVIAALQRTPIRTEELPLLASIAVDARFSVRLRSVAAELVKSSAPEV